MSFDAKCLELAEHFLQDEPTLKGQAKELAEHIQWEIERWIHMKKLPPQKFGGYCDDPARGY